MKKKIYYLFLVLLLVLTSAVSFNKYARAEDDDEEEEEDDAPSTVINTSPGSNTSQKTETVTEYRKLSDTVTQVVTTTTKHDSDGDGMYDDEDPHPTINEYFIVQDANLNGIDDKYEIQP